MLSLLFLTLHYIIASHNGNICIGYYIECYFIRIDKYKYVNININTNINTLCIVCTKIQ